MPTSPEEIQKWQKFFRATFPKAQVTVSDVKNGLVHFTANEIYDFIGHLESKQSLKAGVLHAIKKQPIVGAASSTPRTFSDHHEALEEILNLNGQQILHRICKPVDGVVQNFNQWRVIEGINCTTWMQEFPDDVSAEQCLVGFRYLRSVFSRPPAEILEALRNDKSLEPVMEGKKVCAEEETLLQVVQNGATVSFTLNYGPIFVEFERRYCGYEFAPTVCTEGKGTYFLPTDLLLGYMGEIFQPSVIAYNDGDDLMPIGFAAPDMSQQTYANRSKQVVYFALDTSSSIIGSLETYKAELVALATKIWNSTPECTFKFMTFDAKVSDITPYTKEQSSSLTKRINNLTTTVGTMLYNAMHKAFSDVQSDSTSTTILLVTDGVDTKSHQTVQSLQSLSQTIKSAREGAQEQIGAYFIRVGKRSAVFDDFAQQNGFTIVNVNDFAQLNQIQQYIDEFATSKVVYDFLQQGFLLRTSAGHLKAAANAVPPNTTFKVSGEEYRFGYDQEARDAIENLRLLGELSNDL